MRRVVLAWLVFPARKGIVSGFTILHIVLIR